MSERTKRLLLGCVMVGCLGSLPALAEDARPEPTDPFAGMNGMELYRDLCRPCHAEDSENGEYTPMFLIQEQWDRFFAEQYTEVHTDVVDTLHGGLPVVDVIAPDHLKSIKEFCIEGAADSEHPMTCGG